MAWTDKPFPFSSSPLPFSLTARLFFLFTPTSRNLSHFLYETQRPGQTRLFPFFSSPFHSHHIAILPHSHFFLLHFLYETPRRGQTSLFPFSFPPRFPSSLPHCSFSLPLLITAHTSFTRGQTRFFPFFTSPLPFAVTTLLFSVATSRCLLHFLCEFQRRRRNRLFLFLFSYPSLLIPSLFLLTLFVTATSHDLAKLSYEHL